MEGLKRTEAWRVKFREVVNQHPERYQEVLNQLAPRDRRIVALVMETDSSQGEIVRYLAVEQLGHISPTRVRQVLDDVVTRLTSGEPGKPATVRSTERAYLSQVDVANLTLWLQKHRLEVHGLPAEAALALVREKSRLPVPLATLKTMCQVLEIELKVPPRHHPMPQSQGLRVLATHLVNVYTSLGMPVPDDLWALTGQKED